MRVSHARLTRINCIGFDDKGQWGREGMRLILSKLFESVDEVDKGFKIDIISLVKLN